MFRAFSCWLLVSAVAIGVCAALGAEPRREAYVERVPESTDPVQRERDRLNETYRLRLDYKAQLLQQLIDGRTTLKAVADEFLRMNRDVPATLTGIRIAYPGVPDEEASALNVIDMVARRTEEGDHRDAVLGRLCAEFRDLYGRDFHGQMPIHAEPLRGRTRLR